MKKILTVLAIMMSVLCSSMVLSACSDGYKKMYLEAECVLPKEGGGDDWRKIENGGTFDYILEDAMKSKENPNLYVMYLRINVKGTSKKVDSLYISASQSNAVTLEGNTIKPNEAFEVLVSTVGSVTFTITPPPNKGGEDKAISFTINIYRTLTSINQNEGCVPAIMVGDALNLDELPNLIKYHPINQTNQTGVDYKLVGVGRFDGDGLLAGEFVNNTDFVVAGDGSAITKGGQVMLRLNSTTSGLLLRVDGNYELGTACNVVKLEAKSKYKEELTANVYVYLVETFDTNSWLVSYSSEDSVDVPENEIDDNITIYKAKTSDGIGEDNYSAIKVYTHFKDSIYSYQTTPGMELVVKVNGVEYSYKNAVADKNFGIRVTEIDEETEGSGGVKFSVYPEGTNSQNNIYNIELSVDFTDFDFSASYAKPVNNLKKEFVIAVESLPSAFSINTKSSVDNSDFVEDDDLPYVVDYNDTTKPAELYTTYIQGLGMPLDLRVAPSDAVNSTMYVSFYKSYAVDAEGNVTPDSEVLDIKSIQLLKTKYSGVSYVDGAFVVENAGLYYLSFLETASLVGLEDVYMVCKAVCTPNSFGENKDIPKEYVTHISKIKVIGAVDSIALYSNDAITELNNTYLPVDAVSSQVAYIKFTSNAVIDYSKISISSKGDNISYSANGKDWANTIYANALTLENGGYKIYFKVAKQCTDSIVISSPNGVSLTKQYQFVNVTTSSNGVGVNFEKTYITQFDAVTGNVGTTSNVVYVDTNEVQLSYLALQSGSTVQFSALGDGKSANIKSVKAVSLTQSMTEYGSIKTGEDKDGDGVIDSLYATPLSKFSSTAIKVTNYDGYFFDVKANTIGSTSIMFVKVEYYTTNKDGVEDTEDDNVIYLATKYFVYEIAVYTPARELSVTTDKDSIIYINNDYLEAATANFGVKLNIPTKELIFSSSVINDVINKASDGTTKAIYAVKVESADLSAEWANGYFEVLGLNNGYVSLSKLNTDETFTFMAKKSLEDLTTDGKYSVSFDVVIEQFGQKSSYSLTKVIMFGDYEKSEALLVGGVDAYSNLYLSMANPDAETNVGEVTVKVSNSTATFKDVGYNIYLIKNNATTNKETETKYTGVDFKVEAIEGTNKFKVIADGEFGGVYRVEFYAKDSYNGTKYTVTSSIRVTVSDGKTAETAYLIGTLTEFKALHSNTTNQYYRLSNDINISGLSSDWWSVNRVFAGTLDGASTITNPNTGETISKCYRLIGLTINSDSRVAGAFALFASNTGTIKNVILNEVTYDIILDGDNTSSDVVAIGTIAGTNNGTIENCSITFKKSTVKFANSALNRVYNIGLLAGINNNTIKYNNTQINSEYSYMVDFENGGRFVVELAEGSTNLNSSNIYIGGLVGQNSGGATISATYQDNSDQAIRTLITAVVDMEFKSNYSNANAPITVNTAFGGIVGLNNGTIQNVAISGSLKANDKINMGGIAGENNANIIEVANYGACIEGNVFIDGYSFSYDGTTKTNIYHGYSKQSLENQAKTVNLEQNIGGIIGFNNAGTVDKVRTMFITFDSAEVSIMPQLTYIKGVGNIGGIIGKATDTQLTRAYVENFISESIKDVEVRGQEDEELADEYKKYLIELIAENSNIIGNSANVGGLIACVNDSGSGEETAIDVAFVQANFMINSGAFAEFGAPYNYVYFIGDVYGGTAVSGLLENAYIVHNDISIDETIIEKPVLKIVLSNTTLPTVLTGTADINGIKVGWRQAEDVNNGYPYLIYVEDGEEIKTLTVVPKEIIVKVDNEYFGVVYQKLDTEPSDWETAWTNYYKFENEAYVKLTDTSAPEFSATVYYSKIEPTSPSFEKWGEGLYIQYADDTNSHGFSATAIVYYYDNADNVHKLVTDNSGKGLVEKAILPSIASGIYSVSIVSGEDKAVIQGADAIKFIDTGVVELRFASAFDRTIQDVVTIFIENPLTDEVFDISAGSGLSDVNNMGNNFSTSAGQNALLDVTLQKEDGQIEFNTDNTYMLLTVTSATANKTGETPSVITDYSKYFVFNPLTNKLTIAGKDYYALGSYELQTNELEESIKNIKINVQVSVYLNLAKYSVYVSAENDNKNLYDLTNIDNALLYTKDITITIHNKATALSVEPTNVKTEAGVGVNITAKLSTGYVGNIASGSGDINISDERLSVKDLNQDVLYYALTAENENAKDLYNKAKADYDTNKRKGDRNFSVWDIFDDISITYVKQGYGYDYVLSFRLKEEYRYLSYAGYESKEWLFKLVVTASTNSTLSREISVAFVPQQLMTFRIENYSNLVARDGKVAGTTESEFVSNEVESSLIIPGESGLIKIFAEYSYSYFDNIKVSSTREIIDGKEYFVRFQQMVYDKERNMYVSYAGITSDGSSLTLAPVSYFEDGKYVYDGVIFVRTLLENIVGVRKVFTFTVDAKTYNASGDVIDVSCEKTVISQYRPGVYISVANAVESVDGDKVVYMVEENSNTTQVIAKVYGYEFNIEPRVSLVNMSGDVLLSNQAKYELVSATQDGNGAYNLVYKLRVYSGCPAFKMSMEMELIDGGNKLTSKSEVLTFYSVPYVINNVYIQGESNGSLNINVSTSKDMNLVWTTQTGTSKTDDINSKILALDEDYLKLFHVIGRNQQTALEEKQYFTEFVNSQNTNFSIEQNLDGKYRIVAIEEKNGIVVYFNLYYGYIHTRDLDGNVIDSEIQFSATPTDVCNKLISYNFYLNLLKHSTEDLPAEIKTADELRNMAQGENYILTKDITLDGWTPLTTAIGSLDGNGHVITIKSFNILVTSEINAGLFATISENTIIKNVVIDISQLEREDNVLYVQDLNVLNANVNFGLLAGTNNGLVYNCEIISIGRHKELQIETGASYNVVLGGLIGVNNGNITNSRVGTEYFERITQVTQGKNDVITSYVSCGKLTFTAKGIVAGLVGRNSSGSIISSSYVANTSILNTLANGNSAKNRTAGFVAENSGTIAYSYAKGWENTILSTKARATGCKVYSDAGSVAGFVYLNSGEIHDCYSNIVCESQSAGVAGFVYDTTGGAIRQSYTASTVVAAKSALGLATELPFVGVGLDKDNAGKLLSSKELENCYYLDDGTVTYDKNYDIDIDVVEPKALGLISFATANNLNNYSFVLTGSLEQQLNGVWTYSTGVDKNKTIYSLGTTSLPELTSANIIARSVRFAKYDNGVVSDYEYANGYDAGSNKNPYIIRSVDEYNDVFIDKATGIRDGQGQITEARATTASVRFIDDIDFLVDKVYIDVDTRSNYVLGDTTGRTFTSVDGNGMTISNVVINYTKDDSGSLGLFGEVHYATIKALNILYASLDTSESQIGSTEVLYAGGVAGFAKDVYFIDINLDGSVQIRANNVVGGLVGQLTGNSGIYNVSSNLNVKAGKDSEYSTPYSSSGFAEKQENAEMCPLSYAGGIAGIVDINKNEKSYVNVNKINVASSNVEGGRVGGIAGYFGSGVTSSRLTYVINNDSNIIGRFVAGGIVGDNCGDIELSQINGATIEAQYNYDNEFAKYINDNVATKLDTENSNYGNLSALQGDNVVGGFIGINYGGNVKNSLTKANIGAHPSYGVAKTIGGFVGISYGGDFQYSYSQNYIDLTYNIQNDVGDVVEYSRARVIGGFAGEIDYEGNVEGSTHIGLDNVMVVTWFDESEVANAEVMQGNCSCLDEACDKQHSITLDYIVGAYDSTNVTPRLNKNSTGGAIINFAHYNYVDEESNNEGAEGGTENTPEDFVAMHISTGNANKIVKSESEYRFDIHELYNTAISKNLFEELFLPWPFEVWQLDHTKFLPNLKEDNSTDYIQLYTKDDLKYFELFPDRNFILMNDIDVGDVLGNYVVPIDFSGILVGNLQDQGNYAKFKNITLYANSNNAYGDGAGFFKSVNGARITNIGFNYSNLYVSGSAIGNVGGVAAKSDVLGNSDSGAGTRFENVIVSGKVNTRGSGAVGNLGSLIGSAKRPTIVSCSSTLAYENVKSNNGYVGGMIGYVDGSLEQEDSNGAKTTISAGLIRTSPYNGVMNITTENGTSVGGLIGGATYTDISDNTIANLTGGTLEDIEININNVNNASGESNIGGIVGVANTECQVKNSSAYVKITITNENNVGNYKIGGLVGKLDVTTQSVVEGQHDISASYARLSVYTDPANEITVGGIAGLNVGGAGASIYNVVSQLSINESLHETEGGEPKPNENKADNVIVGGIVARSTSMLSINNAVSIMESNVHYDNKLVGGGIIGQTEADYIINNSASMGYIWANSKTEVVPTILGGLIGSIEGTVSAQTITNSYTVLTLSTAGINKNGWTEGEDDKYNVYANSVIGYTSMSSEFDLIAGVLYSSDYTLVLDDFATEIVSNNAAATLSATPDLTYKQINDPIVNVTASVLINNATYLQKKTDATPNSQADNLRGYIGDNWIWNNDHLPMPVGSQNMLLALGVFTQEGGGVGYNTNSVGKTYSPHILKETDLISVMDFDKEEYSYYLLADTKFDSNAVHTKLNGVILGNNATVNANNNFVEEIGKHSAITNIKFNRSADGTRGIAEKNNGTIFMCGMNYQDLGIYGGIVHTNNGVISYSYNSGNSSVDGAGLAYENTANAVIEHCYFTGSFYAPDAAALATLSGYAIAKTNEGYIGNSYSAGQATRIVENVDAGRHHKVHYDYYANYVSEETFNNLSGRGIVGLSTAELQATTDTESQVFGKHWSVFGMHNRAWINNDGEITAYMTYNYGYPIHRIKQYNGIVDYIPHQGKATGNGTFTLLASGYNKESVKLEAENVLQGRLVYSSYVDDCGNENHEYYDDCSYLINNIGVLNQINEIANETTANTYFELDANIQLPETTGYKEGTDLLLSAWPGISGFSGVFSSFPEAINPENEEYCIDTVDAENTTEKDAEKVGSFKDKTKLIANVKPKTIINLRGNALFNSATTEKGIDGDESNAVIANIMLNNSFVNDATLITSVVDADTDDTIKPVVTIYKAGVGVSADLVGAGSITALGTDAYGLVGTVGTTETTDITLNIHSAIYDNVKFANAKNIAGMVGTNYGTINVKNSFNSETGFELLDSCADATVAGFVNDNNKGLINLYTPITLELTISSGESMPISDFSGFATVNTGTIIGTSVDSDDKSAINIAGVTATNSISGLIGSMNDGQVDGFSVTFSGNYECESFGGVVGVLKKGIIGGSSDGAEGKGIAVTISSVQSVTYFGGIACETDDDGTIGKVSISASDIVINENAKNEDPKEGAYGFVIGTCNSAGDTNYTRDINYTIESATEFKVYGINVGAVIGVSKCDSYNFNCGKPSTVTVYGLGNVGGFAGIHGEGDTLGLDCVSIDNWVIKGEDTDEPYARVEAVVEEGDSGKSCQNFGGFIGFWNSSATLTGVTNANSVLDDGDIIQYVSGLECDNVIYNIGGIVGQTLGGVANSVNKAQIGVNLSGTTNPHEGNNILYGTQSKTAESNEDSSIAELPNFYNVGGIIGFASENVNFLNLTGSSNSVQVAGINAVGGLIGASGGDLTISMESFVNTAISCKVIGLIDVGGVIGFVAGDAGFTATKPSASEPIAIDEPIAGDSKLQIYGITNVGGVVGRSDGSATIKFGECEFAFTSVMGNVNVGGIVGFSDGGNISNVTITETSKVYGTMFDYYFDLTDDGMDNGEIHYYHPTNIGGVVGYIHNTSAFDNITTNALVLTDSAYTVEGGTYQLTMINNHVGSPTGTPTDTPGRGKWYEGIYGITGNNVKYADETGGVGGFAGCLDTIDALTACSVKNDVYAPYGINVGGAYGVWNGSGNDRSVPIPTLGAVDTSINVAGKMFIGATIGKVGGWNTDVTESDINVNVQQYDLNKVDNDPDTTGTKVLQGFCIGGVLGYSTGEVSGIELTKQGDASCGIKVYNSANLGVESSNIGVIVGRLDAEMSGCIADWSVCDANSNGSWGYNSIEGIIQSPKVYNYGGLIGLLNLSSDTITITGTHYYAFTIDTIQSNQFENGASAYQYGDEDVLTANAHYFNTANINIIPSKLTGLYNSSGTANKNPINEKARGWAKEYTMFRMMSRLIGQESESEVGDSVQVIYSANYITEVYTASGNKEIVYTIYQPLGQVATLYCKYGIAELDESFYSSLESGVSNGSIIKTGQYKYYLNIEENNNANNNYEGYYRVTVDDMKGDYTTSRGKFWTNVSYEKLGVDPTNPAMVDQSTGIIKEAYDDDLEAPEKYHYTYGFTYYHCDGYLGENSTKNYFKFKTIFGQYEDGVITAEKNGIRAENYYSNSGSLFEVTGVSVSYEIEYALDNERSWKMFALFAITTAAILAIIIFPGLSAGIIKGLGLLMQVACKASIVTTAMSKAALIIYGAGLFSGTLVASNFLNQGIAQATYHARTLVSGLDDVSQGYLYSSYSRQIAWDNGEMDPYYDSFIIAEVNFTGTCSEGASITDYKGLAEDLGITYNGTSVTGKIPLYYYSCSSAYEVPPDINEPITVSVASMEASSTTQESFNAWGITSISIPRYQRVDGDLYVYNTQTVIGGSLYKNYNDLNKMVDDGTIKSAYHIENINGNGYILDVSAYDAYKIPEGTDLSYFNMNREVISQRNCVLSDNSTYSVETLDSEKLKEYRWDEGECLVTTAYVNISKTLYYHGLSEPSGVGYVTRKAKKEGGKIYYYDNGWKEAGTTADANEANLTAYFVVNGSGASIQVKLVPEKGSGEGILASELGITVAYLQPDENGSITGVDCTFVLAHVDSGTYKAAEDHVYVRGEKIPAQALQEEYTLYKLNPKATTSGKLIEKVGEMSLSNILADWDQYQNYYLDEYCCSQVSKTFEKYDGELYTKKVSARYSAKKVGEDITLIYQPILSGIQISGSFKNRYVYNLDGYKLYTRFYYGEGFGDASVDSKSIKGLLLPKSSDGTEIKNITFNESVRVTLSCSDSVKIFKGKDSVVSGVGKISVVE